MQQVMEPSADVRSRLQSLRIAKDQRPDAGRPARRRRWPRVLVVLVLLAGAAGLAYKLGGDRLADSLGTPASANAVEIYKVTPRTDADVPSALVATGKIVSDHRVYITTKVSGQIVELFFEQGDRVKKEQLLAKIEDVTYRAQRDEAASMLEKARANLAYQEVNFQRVSTLYNENTAPDIEMADARRARDEAKAQVSAAEAGLVYAQKALDDCNVLAPIAGVILERNVAVGDFVAAEGGRGANANAQLGTIADMQALRVEVDVSELDIAKLRKGMPCVVTPDAYKDRRYRGHVMWIDPGANYSKATVGVKVRIEEPDDSLRVEGSAQVNFLTGEPPSPTTTPSASTIWIPASAVRRDPAGGNRGTVFVDDAGRFRATPVTLGRSQGTHVEVLGGLVMDQRIAATGLDRVQDGQAVPGSR